MLTRLLTGEATLRPVFSFLAGRVFCRCRLRPDVLFSNWGALYNGKIS